MKFNKITKINDLYDALEELECIKNTGYIKLPISYDYIYKWSIMLKYIKFFDLLKPNNKFVDLGGGLSPLQFILSNNGCKVYNLDYNFLGWFPFKGKYNLYATDEFINLSNKNISNIEFIQGNILDTIKNIPDESIDCVIDTCSLHIFIGDGTNGIMDQISRILKSDGYFISVGDIANINLGKCDIEFKYPDDMAKILNSNENLKLIEPYDYDTWDDELKDYNNIIDRKEIDFNDLSLINMKNDPTKIPYGNISTYPIHLWTSTYILKKNNN